MAHSYSKNYQHIAFGDKFRETVLDSKNNLHKKQQKHNLGLAMYNKILFAIISNAIKQ